MKYARAITKIARSLNPTNTLPIQLHRNTYTRTLDRYLPIHRTPAHYRTLIAADKRGPRDVRAVRCDGALPGEAGRCLQQRRPQHRGDRGPGPQPRPRYRSHTRARALRCCRQSVRMCFR